MAVVLLAVFSLALTSCGGGGAGDGGDEDATRYTVTAIAGAGGGISPASASVNSGATASFTVTPDGGNTINTVNGCGGTLIGATYTTGAITANCTVSANFTGLPTISITDTSVAEGDSGTTSLVFTITLNTLANGNVDVDFATSDSSPALGSATAGSDYTASNGTLTIPAASTSATISISVLGDTDVEGDETLTLTLSNPSGNATLATATATGTIFNDEIITRALNDTGITTCATATTGSSGTNLSCNDIAVGTDAFPGQDAEYGRDATVNDDNDGRAGFSFTKLDSSGNPLSASATSWDCVKDNVTGLVWEVKTIEVGSLHRNSHAFTWYNSTGINDGGNPGTPNGGICVDSSNCDTEKFVAAVNAAGLCGQNDWRLPSVDELRTLLDSSVGFPNLAIDTNYFPNGFDNYWTSNTFALTSHGGQAWTVTFDNFGGVNTSSKSSSRSVRLVRDSL